MEGDTHHLAPPISLGLAHPRGSMSSLALLDALRAALALTNHLIEYPSTRVQLRTSDPVGVPGIEPADLR
jgi:hypothetical protein